MKELATSLKNQISTRINSPLFGAFALAWLTFNHKYFIILFSSGSIESRLDLARVTCFPDGISILVNGILNPLYGAMAFLIFYPILSILVFAWWQKTQVWLKFVKMYIDQTMPHNQDEYNKLAVDYDALERKQQKEIVDLRNEKATLAVQQEDAEANEQLTKVELVRTHKKLKAISKELKLLKKEAESYKKQLEKSTKTLKETELRLLQLGEVRHEVAQYVDPNK